MNLAQVFHSGMTLYPNAVAVHHGKHHLTYERLFHDVERIAGHLLGAGIGPGELVGLDVQRPLSHWVVLLALMRLGARSVSLTDRFEAEVSALYGLEAVITDRKPARTLPPHVRSLGVQSTWLQQEPEPGRSLPSPRAAAEAIARVCFTSGASGRPKAVELGSERLHARLSGTARRGRINTRSVLWCGLGADVAYGFTAPVAAWLEGAAVVFSLGGRGAYAYLSARQVNLVIASPAALGVLLRDATASTLPPLDASAIVAGGRLSIALRDALLGRVCTEVLVAYGSSEAGGVTLGDARGLDAHPGHVGTVFPDVEAMVVDEAGRPLPPGAVGRLATRSDAAASGYLDDPHDTAQHFSDGWFIPGDVASLSADRELTVLGRPSDSLNVGGVKVSAEDLDARAREHDGVQDACALVLPHDRLAVAIVGRPRNEEALAAAIRAGLPTLPRFQLLSLPSIPRGSMGKVNRDRLAELIDAALALPPGGPLAGRVAVLGTF
jgi:acyl-coenzyme A synthetase/AMP-(fatty) acid ligase